MSCAKSSAEGNKRKGRLKSFQTAFGQIFRQGVHTFAEQQPSGR